MLVLKTSRGQGGLKDRSKRDPNKKKIGQVRTLNISADPEPISCFTKQRQTCLIRTFPIDKMVTLLVIVFTFVSMEGLSLVISIMFAHL